MEAETARTGKVIAQAFDAPSMLDKQKDSDIIF